MKYQRLIEKPTKSFFLFGARWTGKSTWLRDEFNGALWIDLLDEKRYQSYLACPEEFAQAILAAPREQWIVVDEILRLPNLLAGRATRRNMYPLVPNEMGTEFDPEEVLTYGSIPLVWQSEDKRESLEDYAQMYLREEIQAEAIVRNLPAFARFLPVAALLHGKVLGISSLARDAGAHRNTIAGYIEILEDTLIAFRLAPFQGNIRIKEKRHPKLYFIDSGLVRALKKNLYPIAPEERGSLFEGWFVNYVRAMGEYNNIFDEMYY